MYERDSIHLVTLFTQRRTFMKNRTYAARLTKEDLIKGGITLVTEEGLVFKGEQQVTPAIAANGYFMIQIYALDEDGNKIKVPLKRLYKGCKNVSDTYTYKVRTLGLHRIMWAWFNGEVPEGYVVDHVNNKHENMEDYRLENLQLLTPAENIVKERGESTKQMTCSLKRPLSWYENRLNGYLVEYEEAKRNHEADRAHKLRTNIANTKARIRYYVANKGEN